MTSLTTNDKNDLTFLVDSIYFQLHKSFGKLLAKLVTQGTTTFTKAKRNHRLNVQRLLDAVDV
jgi:hypothetical protein